MDYHVPVLLKESVEGLNIQENGTYVDVTFGGGGHSQKIISRLSSGKLYAFDQDPDAQENVRVSGLDDNRSFIFVPANFRYLEKYLRLHGVEAVDGILADLGISSHQIDSDIRGFSTRLEGDLDMRMNKKGSLTAQEVINQYSEDQLIHVLSFYGEVRNARTLASRIVQQRVIKPILDTRRLREVAQAVAPKGKLERYLAQIFQAVRIEVNDELGALKELLMQSRQCLKEGGRLVVISYHSLEDRIVKNFLNYGNFKGHPEKDFYGNLIRPFEPVNRKPITPDQNEITENKRARSAKLRIGVKGHGN